MGAFYWLQEISRPKFVRYPGFGIDLPSRYDIHGIDVSRYQYSIDWPEVKAMQVKQVNIGFCFMKATEGLNSVDPYFRYNWRLTKKTGIPRGAYHFFNPSKNGKDQAQHFIDQVSLLPGDLPPVLDVEQLNGISPVLLRQRVNECLTALESHYKVKPILYTNAGFYKDYLGEAFDEYPLWVAHYLVRDKPRVKRNWVFWQHNEQGRVNGIDAPVDFNVFHGDSSAFKSLLLP